MNKNPYNNNNLKYSFSENEMKIIDNVWEFINYFRETFLTRGKYRRNIKNKIRQKYSIEEFYKYEKIVEKLYWNLVNKIKSEINLDQKIYIKRKFNLKNIENRILKRNVKVKESNVNKTYVITDNNELIYKYKYPDDLDITVSSIMINRSVYETIMSDEENIFNIDIEPYNNIVEFDYLFPNLNTIKSFVNNKNERINKISKMFYDGDNK
jgi:hypothetical protein